MSKIFHLINQYIRPWCVRFLSPRPLTKPTVRASHVGPDTFSPILKPYSYCLFGNTLSNTPPKGLRDFIAFWAMCPCYATMRPFKILIKFTYLIINPFAFLCNSMLFIGHFEANPKDQRFISFRTFTVKILNFLEIR